jgi:hypothetical protein
MGSTTTLPYTMGVTVVGTKKNGSVTIGVGTYTQFSSSLISHMLPLITSSTRKTVCFVSTILEYLSEQQKWSPYDLSRYLMKWQVTVLGSNFPIVGLNSLAPD